MKRHSFKLPGYDCFAGVCPHVPKCDPAKKQGGRHGEEWHYVVQADDGLSAAALRVFTKITPKPGLRYHEDPPDGVSAADLSLHLGYTHEDELGRLVSPKPEQACDYLGRTSCNEVYNACLPAGELWKHADP